MWNEWLKILGKLFVVYDESKANGKKISEVMVFAGLLVVSTLVVQLTPLTTGLTDAQIAEISKYGFGIFGIVMGWLRYDTTKELAVRTDRVAGNSDKGDSDKDEHVPDILNDN